MWSGRKGSLQLKSNLLKVRRSEISGPAQIAFEHFVPMPPIGIPIRPCTSSDFLAYGEPAMLAGKSEGWDAAQPGEPLRTAWRDGKRLLVVVSLTKRINPVLANPGEMVRCSLWHTPMDLLLSGATQACPGATQSLIWMKYTVWVAKTQEQGGVPTQRTHQPSVSYRDLSTVGTKSWNSLLNRPKSGHEPFNSNIYTLPPVDMHEELDRGELGRCSLIGVRNRVGKDRGDVSMAGTPNHHNKKLTIHGIAEMAHVSAGTVSRVLNNQPGVGAQTRANIQAIIQEQGYRASFFARNLLARQSFAIGLVFSGKASELFAHPIFPELLGAIGDSLTNAGYTLTLITGVSPERNQRILREAAEGRIDGVHDYSIFQLTRSLIGEGHRRIALVNGPTDLSACVLRSAGYHKALQEAGLSISSTFERFGSFNAKHGYQSTLDLLRLPVGERPTAIVAGSDLIAVGCLEAAQTQGLHVPGDLAVTGFDDNILATFAHPPLTTVKMPLRDMGRTSVDILLQVIQGKRESSQPVILPCEIILRESFSGPLR